jgi:hypothetical protein
VLLSDVRESVVVLRIASRWQGRMTLEFLRVGSVIVPPALGTATAEGEGALHHLVTVGARAGRVLRTISRARSLARRPSAARASSRSR